MKKLLVLVLAAVLMLSLASCGFASDTAKELKEDLTSLADDLKTELGGESAAPSEETAEAETPAPTEAAAEETPAEASAEESAASSGTEDFSSLSSGEYAAAMTSGKYYMEYTAYVMGFEMDSKQACENGNTDTITDTMGILVRSLTLGTTQYEIDDANKQYTKTELSEELLPDAGSIDYTALKYVSSGNDVIPDFEDVDSASYDYDEYAMSIISGDSEMKIVMRYYFKDGELYVISTDMDGLVSNMKISLFSQDIPEGMLELPEGYTEVDELTYF